MVQNGNLRWSNTIYIRFEQKLHAKLNARFKRQIFHVLNSIQLGCWLE